MTVPRNVTPYCLSPPTTPPILPRKCRLHAPALPHRCADVAVRALEERSEISDLLAVASR
jgi:hypothetical protein